MKKTVSAYPLRLPVSLKAAAEEISAEDGTSLNQFIVTAVAEKLSAMRTHAFFAERAQKGDVEKALAILSRDGGAEPLEEDRI